MFYNNNIEIMLLGLSAYNSSSSDDEQEKPVKGKKKISIPKPTYSSDEDEPMKKKPNFGDQQTPSGLFSKLPAPQNIVGSGKQANRALIPHVFSKKPDLTKTKIKGKPKAKSAIENEPDSSDDEGDVSFFTFEDKPSEVENALHPATTNDVIASPHVNAVTPSQSVSHTSYNPYLDPEPSHESEKGSTPTHKKSKLVQGSNNESGVGTSMQPLWDQDERFKRIQGKRNFKEKIEFIEVNADSALEGNKELLLQQISEEKNINRTSHSKKNSNAPSAQSKRKHQLTYLIHQAKEREVELKNAWAAGRAAREAARNRYGF